MPVVNRVAKLHAQKEQRENRRISFSEVGRQAGISRQTLSSWFSNDVSTFYPDVIEALCRYYDCSIGDLLEIVEDAPKGQRVAVLAVAGS